MSDDLLKTIDQLSPAQFMELCDKFFDVLSKNYMNRVPGVYHPDNRIVELAQKRNLICLPAHFYSPVPTKEEIRDYRNDEYSTVGIGWNDAVQLSYLNACKNIQTDLLSCSIDQKNEFEFYWNNSSFSHSDAAFYYSLIQIKHPKKVIEVGAGNSTKLAISSLLKQESNVSNILSIIEPYPSNELISIAKKHKVEIIERKIQDVPIEYFARLEENDILFYDGSHVSKFGSDVNHFIFNILPTLKSGVLIHIHDIFLPNELPSNWIDELNLFWNEQYVLHAFLMYNESFEIVFSSRYLATHHRKEMDEVLTAPLKHLGNCGGSIWIRRK